MKNNDKFIIIHISCPFFLSLNIRFFLLFQLPKHTNLLQHKRFYVGFRRKMQLQNQKATQIVQKQYIKLKKY